MKGHGRTSAQSITGVLIGAVASSFAGCGGNGNSGYTAPPMTQPPTGAFSQPAAAVSINFGQALTLGWSSANSTSCTASASGTTAGAFTGSQGVTNSVTVAPTAPGSFTYSLSCTGPGGTVSFSSTTVTVNPSLLSALTPTGTIPTVGSTVDPVNGDQNPYGLTIAPATSGLITKGDLVVCNFNNGNTGPTPNTQGLGTTLIGLHPGVNSTPYRIAQSADLEGCSAITMLSDDSISAAAWSSNLNPLVSSAGTVGTGFSTDTFANPWGEAYVPVSASQPAAIYVSNAPGGSAFSAGGTIDRISLTADSQTTFTEIATGFCTSGAPGAIFGPSGLTYDPANDTLYIVDTSSASVIAIAGVSAIGQDGVVANGQCAGTAVPTAVPTFTGPSMASARVIAHGSPLSTPLSAALLADGDLLVANADIGVSDASATTNLLIEVSPVLPGGFVGSPLQVDNGTPGALFGLAATVDVNGNQIVYFNDDNAAAVMQLGPAP